MNKRKGFTLIELLAVIVILAIIALIATPIVMNVIEKSKKGAAERSAENYIDAVETKVVAERLDNKIMEGTYTIDENGNLISNGLEESLKIEMSGNKPANGIVTITNGQVASGILCIGGNKVKYDENGIEIIGTCTGTETCWLELGTALEIGSRYVCTVKEGETQIFYVLEDGDTTGLTPETGGIATPGTVSLIMDRNIDDEEVSFDSCGLGDLSIKEVATKLESITKSEKDGGFGWTTVTADEVSLPTANQIAQVTNPNFPDSWNASTSSDWFYFGSGNTTDTSKRHNYAWLYNYIKTCTSYGCDVGDSTYSLGYWTSTPHSSSYFSSYTNWNVLFDGSLFSYYYGAECVYGIRPVITISKSNLSS